MHIKALHSQEIVVRAAQDPITHPPTGNMDETGIFFIQHPNLYLFPSPLFWSHGSEGTLCGQMAQNSHQLSSPQPHGGCSLSQDTRTALGGHSDISHFPIWRVLQTIIANWSDPSPRHSTHDSPAKGSVILLSWKTLPGKESIRQLTGAALCWTLPKMYFPSAIFQLTLCIPGS